MPASAPKPCRHPGCSALVRGGSWCPTHQRPEPGSFADPFRGSRQSRGYGAGWEKLRQSVFARDCGMCQECRRRGIITAPVGRNRICDHIIPKAEGGTDDTNNLQTLCKRCSDAKTAEEAKRGRLGRGAG